MNLLKRAGDFCMCCMGGCFHLEVLRVELYDELMRFNNGLDQLNKFVRLLVIRKYCDCGGFPGMRIGSGNYFAFSINQFR